MTSEQKALRLVGALTIAFGILCALGAHPALGGFTYQMIDLVLWPAERATGAVTGEARLLYAVTGGLAAGLGWVTWVLAGEGLSRAPELARKTIAGSALTWFAVDSTASVAAGAPLNVVGNLAFLALFLVPLWRGQRRALS
jgi:hypothetical protein